MLNEFVNTFRDYSAIDVLDFERLGNQYNILLSPYFDDNAEAGWDLGHLPHTTHIMIGNITRTATGYALQMQITKTEDKMTSASYSGIFTFAELDDLTGIRRATLELLQKMGVTLTAQAQEKLARSETVNRVNAQTAFARGITSERSGTVVEALTYYYQAVSFDSSLLEAANRASVISTAITSGNIGENVRNDIQQRNEWIKIFDEANTFFKDRTPFVIMYDPTLEQGNINYRSETVDLFFRVTVIPNDDIFCVLSDLRKGLNASGGRQRWGLNWPYSRGDVLDIDKSRLDITVILKNSEGKQIASTQIRLNIEGYNLVDGGERKFGVTPTSDSYNVPRRGFTFSSVNANDITDTLTIQITRVNGVNVLDPANSGYIGIRTGSVPPRRYF